MFGNNPAETRMSSIGIAQFLEQARGTLKCAHDRDRSALYRYRFAGRERVDTYSPGTDAALWWRELPE